MHYAVNQMYSANLEAFVERVIHHDQHLRVFVQHDGAAWLHEIELREVWQATDLLLMILSIRERNAQATLRIPIRRLLRFAEEQIVELVLQGGIVFLGNLTICHLQHARLLPPVLVCVLQQYKKYTCAMYYVHPLFHTWILESTLNKGTAVPAGFSGESTMSITGEFGGDDGDGDGDRKRSVSNTDCNREVASIT